MSRYRKYPEETYERIVQMREAGQSCAAIAAALGCSAGMVSWTCLRLGAVSPKRPFRPSRRNAAGGSVRRGGHVVKLFSVDEDRQLLALEAEGLRYSEIAKRLGRRPNSIVGRLMTLARHEEARS